ncbi:hypothetical protein B484DRAFT_454676 [Ochromonadaceae sp. CCMP2298]|nr:hypothetical protein B484DRAFT_454676 [Ochromonadaceae sp. CCMP2298]
MLPPLAVALSVALLAAVQLQPSSADTFPHTTALLSDTDSAKQNYEEAAVWACPDDKLVFSTCDVAPADLDTADTFLRLYMGDTKVAQNDDWSNAPDDNDECSRIVYTYTEASCGWLTLRMGCYDDTDCFMTATVSVSHTNLFPYTTGVLSDTDSARQNYVSVWQSVCPDEEYTFSTCDQRGPQSAIDNDYGDTFLRLFLDGVIVKQNDDFWGANDDNDEDNDVCSRIKYTYTEAACGHLELRLGCYDDDECDMIATSTKTYVRPPFDWDKYHAAGNDELKTFNGNAQSLLGASDCRQLEQGNTGHIIAKSGVVRMDRAEDTDCETNSNCGDMVTTMNGYARMHVNDRPVTLATTKLTLVFGKVGHREELFRWRQPLMEETDVVTLNAEGMGDGELKQQDFEFAWQMRLNTDMEGSDGNLRNFPQGSNYYLEVQIEQGVSVRSCLRIDNLKV